MNENQTQKKHGVWFWIGRVMLIFLLIGLVLAFGWIAGIIWLVFSRKKLDAQPAKQKKMTIAISIGSIASFIIMVAAILNSSENQERPYSNIGQNHFIAEDKTTTEDLDLSETSTTRPPDTTPKPTTTQPPTTTEAPTTTQPPTTTEPPTEPPTQPPTEPPTQPPTQPPTEPPIEDSPVVNNTHSYVLNTNTHKIHSPSCRYVNEIAQKNYSTWSGDSVDDFLASNPKYSRCKKCNPR